jgi:hypothetical protein
MDLIKERDAALKQARGHAKLGHFGMAQAFITHANSFATVSARQVKNVQNLLDRGREKRSVL